MLKKRWRILTACGLVMLLFATFASVTKAAPQFANNSFKDVWEYSDKLLEQQSNPGRGYTWGPNSFGIVQEDYADAPGGKRQVQYFDKSRMEVAPTGVTNGLLTKELVSGNRQDGNSKFTQLSPSTVQVAGDDNSAGGNAVAPTYASFKNVVSNSPGENRATNRTTQNITQAIDKAGNVTTLASVPQQITIGYYDNVLGHNVPQVFVQFQNQTGLVWNAGRQTYQPQQIYTDNPTANVFGLPITEPFWVKAVVAGQTRDVLVQLFERRVLTFTPANADPFKVEMGNIGQHYYKWRYSNTTSTPTPTPTTSPVPPQKQWLARVNAYRAAAGLPAVTEDADLSAADAKHVKYMLLNPDQMEHNEDSSRPGYTPEGQKAAQQSNLAWGSPQFLSETGSVDLWMTDIPHRYAILHPALTKVGFAVACENQNCAAALNILAGLNGPRTKGGVVFPGDKQTGVIFKLITWQFLSEEGTLQLNSATLKDAQGNIVETKSEVSTGYWLAIGITPTQPLAANTTYTVEMKVTLGGTPLSKTWSFTTA